MRRSGRTTRMLDQVLDWCRNMERVPRGKPGPIVAVMCADSNHRKNLQTAFILRAEERNMHAERSHLEQVCLWEANGDHRCSVAFRTPQETAVTRGMGMAKMFVDHHALESELARALEPFGSAFYQVALAVTIERVVAELLPDQYKENRETK